MKKKEMTIFEIITSVQLGGAENVAIAIAEYCASQETKSNIIFFEIHKTNNTYAADLKKKLRASGIQLYTLGTSNKYLSLLVAPFTLLYYILLKKPVIVHSHTDLPDFVLSSSLKMLFKRKFHIVRTIHNTKLWHTHPVIGKFTVRSFKNDTIVGVSDAALNAYCEKRTRFKLNISPNRHIIYNGIKPPVKENHPFQLYTQKINIAFAGRLELQKGIDIFLELMSGLPAELKEKFHFHIIGDGTFKPQVIAFCNSNTFCTYYGPVSNLANKLYCFDYLCMTSRYEGFGLVAVEAAFAGVPVIAPKVAGLEEIFPPNWPLLTNLLSKEEFETILKKIAANEFDQKILGKHAFDFASSHFSHTKMGKSYIAVYKKLLNQPL